MAQFSTRVSVGGGLGDGPVAEEEGVGCLSGALGFGNGGAALVVDALEIQVEKKMRGR